MTPQEFAVLVEVLNRAPMTKAEIIVIERLVNEIKPRPQPERAEEAR